MRLRKGLGRAGVSPTAQEASRSSRRTAPKCWPERRRRSRRGLRFTTMPILPVEESAATAGDAVDYRDSIGKPEDYSLPIRAPYALRPGYDGKFAKGVLPACAGRFFRQTGLTQALLTLGLFKRGPDESGPLLFSAGVGHLDRFAPLEPRG